VAETVPSVMNATVFNNMKYKVFALVAGTGPGVANAAVVEAL
jgi:hypothetical protein